MNEEDYRNLVEAFARNPRHEIKHGIRFECDIRFQMIISIPWRMDFKSTYAQMVYKTIVGHFCEAYQGKVPKRGAEIEYFVHLCKKVKGETARPDIRKLLVLGDAAESGDGSVARAISHIEQILNGH
jgi:hypothetical protein